MSVRVYLTGRIAAEADGEIIVEERQLRGKQGRLAFAYLVCQRTRPVPREELASVVWPGEPAPAWQSALSALVSRLRSVLAARPLRERGVALSGDFGLYRLVLPADTWVDVEAGITTLDEAEGFLRAGEVGRVLGPATVAASIARRPFLAGVEGEWADSQRRRLERQLLRALDCLTRMWLATGEPALAIETAVEAVDMDPLREGGYQLLMRAYAASGNRAQAVRAYHRLRGLLAESLGTDPAPETEALYLEVLG